MTAYNKLSMFYDSFTKDVPYEQFISFYEQVFSEKTPSLVLDLGCGTGTICNMLSLKGYEMIGVDMSEDMLMEAQNKSYELLDNRPIYLKQKMHELDLYGTVDACISSLDCINYITDADNLFETFKKVDNFLNPDGFFIFDINTKKKLKNLDGQAFIREDEGAFCVWQALFEDDLCTYNFDIFIESSDGKYERFLEQHTERAYEIDYIKNLLIKAGFYDIKIYDELSFNTYDENSDRVFFVCKSKGDKK